MPVHSGNRPEAQDNQPPQPVAGKERPAGAGGTTPPVRIIDKAFRYLVDRYTEELQPRSLEKALESAGFALSSPELRTAATRFAELFPGAEIVSRRMSAIGYVAGDNAAGSRKKRIVKEMLLLSLAGENTALDNFREVLGRCRAGPDVRLPGDCQGA